MRLYKKSLTSPPSYGSLGKISTVALGEVDTKSGDKAVKLKFLTPGIHIDWLFVRKL